MKNLNSLFLATAFTLTTLPLMAREIDSLSLNSSDIQAGKPVEITIDFKKIEDDAPNNQAATSILGAVTPTNSQAKVNLPCAVKVDFGDRQFEHVRVDGDSPSLKISHTYDKAGSYALNAEGKLQIRGLKSVFACSGNALKVTANVLSEEIVSKHEELNLQNVPNNFTQTSKIETKGLSSKELFKRGIEAYQAKQYQDAQTLLSLGLKSKPKDAYANLYLGLSLKELNQNEGATKALKTALKESLSNGNKQLAKQALGEINTSINKIASEKTSTSLAQSLDSSSQAWISDSKGCKVAFPYQTSGVSITWSGKCKDGFIDGYGKINYIPFNTSYEGNVTKGFLNGKAVYIDDGSGFRYEGNYVNNRRNGKGILKYKDGTYKEGEFVNDEAVNYTRYDKNGVADGIFVNGKKTEKTQTQVASALASSTSITSAPSTAYDSSAASPDLMFDIISGITGIVVQNKINHDAKRQRQAAAQQQAQQQAYQQAQAEQQAYDNSRAQLDAQRAQQTQANTEIYVGPVTSASASNSSGNNICSVAHNPADISANRASCICGGGRFSTTQHGWICHGEAGGIKGACENSTGRWQCNAQ